MNKELKIKAWIAFTGIILLFSCNKNNTSALNESNFIKAKILEYGTDIPIEGATITVWTNPGGKISTITNSNGESNIEGTDSTPGPVA